jgi:hypothetical protein
MTVTQLHKTLTALIQQGKGRHQIQALIDTPDSFSDGELVDVAIHHSKPRIVLHIEQLPAPEDRRG